MSTAETRRPLAEATALATALCEDLSTACERIELAGSIRRRRPDIGDVELVAIPRRVAEHDLFGGPTGHTRSVLEEAVARMLTVGGLAPRFSPDGASRLGPKYKALVYRGMAVDLFITTAECFGVIMTIRTGPADFSHRLVTPRPQGGLLPNHLRVRDGRLVGTDGQPLATPEEADVFAAMGLDYIAPEVRR